MKIKNINGTSQATCPCGSWIKHWQKFGGGTVPEYCPASGCLKKDILGAHVQKPDSTDNKWYIYPLCSSHNQHEGELEVSSVWKLVSANKRETCEK